MEQQSQPESSNSSTSENDKWENWQKSRIHERKSKKGTLEFWKRSWFWLVILPVALSFLYYGVIASDRYVGNAKVIVKQADNGNSHDFDIPLIGAGASAGMQDARLVREFILSLDMLHYLDKALDLRRHYESKEADILSRLWENESQEAFLKYYRKHLTVVYDEQSSVLTISAQAFTPVFAQRIVQTLLEHSEQYINQISHRLALEQVRFVEKELERASEHLRQSKKAVLKFQEQYELFSPTEESGAKLAMVNELEAELTRHKADLNNLRSYMNEEAADILALKAKIGAVEKQLMVERKKLVGEGGLNFGDVTARYADLQLDLEFATDLYKASLVSLEQARIEAYRKLKHLVVVDSPSLAEEPELPRRVYNLVSILVVLLLLYGVFKIIMATIREHQDV